MPGLLLDQSLDWLDYLSRGGVVGFLVLMLWGGYRRWWVFGWQYDAVCQDRDEWKDIALRHGGMSQEAIDVAKEAIRPRNRR